MIYRPPRRAMLTMVAVVYMALGATTASAQEEDLNTRYAFPVSIGAEYQMLTPFASEASGFTAFEAAVSVRVPIPGSPRLQPLARFGMMQFTDNDISTGDWSHNHYYGGLGIAWANRIDRTFELTADAIVGVSEAVFSELAPDLGTIGSLNGFVEIGGRISLDPSYSIAIDIHPTLKWVQSFSVLRDFNGPIFGIGFAVNYRFGEDPDSALAIIRSLKLTDVVFPDAFAAMQSYYATNPIGSVVIENTESNDVTDLHIAFEQKGFMEAPTPSASIEVLVPGEPVTVDIFASYNANVFLTEGTTPLVGEIIATYFYRGRPVEQRSSVSYVLRDKTSMTWTDDEKVAAFITYEDSALRNYASWIRQSSKEQTVSGLSSSLQTAIQIYEALDELGILYQTDPSKPAFEEVQGNPVIIDSVSLPRDTLSRTTGDCDDLTVLYSSLLESVGIDTAFITTPGHIYAAFNTGVAARDYRQLHPDRRMTLPIDGELWIPVEITLIGTQGFMSAWRYGIDEWSAHETTPQNRALYLTDVAQATYWPVGLQQTDLGLQYGNPKSISDAFNQEIVRLADLIVSDYRERAAASGRQQDYNRLGIAHSRLDQYQAAARAFEQALMIDSEYQSARVNLANILFLEEDFEGSLAGYTGVYEQMAAGGDTDSTLAAQVLLNMSRAQYELEMFDDASTTFAVAQEVDAAAVADFAYIGAATEGQGRAAEQGGPSILFVGEGE